MSIDAASPIPYGPEGSGINIEGPKTGVFNAIICFKEYPFPIIKYIYIYIYTFLHSLLEGLQEVLHQNK